jgi:hypothetical protein
MLMTLLFLQDASSTGSSIEAFLSLDAGFSM